MKKTICMILVIILVAFKSVPAHAEEFQKKFVLEKEIKPCVFQIFWENKDVSADIKLTAPDGKVYDKNSENYNSMEGLVWISVDTAPPGEWTVQIDGENLGKIDLEAGAVPNYIKITKFDVSQVSSSEFDISWEAANTSGPVNFSVYVDRKSSGYGGVKVSEFSGEAKGTRRINIGDTDSGDYYLFLKAEDTHGITDFKYASSYFKIVNPNANFKVNNLTHGMLNDQVYAKWDASSDKVYRFMLFNKGEAEPFFEDETENGWYSYPLPSGAKDVELAVAEVYMGKLGDYERFSVNTDVKLDYKVSFPPNENINFKSIMINTSFDKPLSMSIYINGKAYVEKTDKPGDYKIDLLDGENTVAVVFMDEKGNIKGEQKNFYVDTYPPQIQMAADIDGRIVSKPSIMVSGETEPGAKLSINKKDTPVDNTGSYSQKVSLRPGKNKITIIAVDAAGNESNVVVTVTFNIFGSNIFYIVTGSAIFTALAVYYLVLLIKFNMKNKNRGRKEKGETAGQDKRGGGTDEKDI